MEFFQKTAEEALKKFNVDRSTGLTNEQVLESQKKYGKNQFSKAEKVPLIKKIIEALKEPMIFILFIAAIITIGINLYKYYSGLHAEFTESIGIVVAISLSVGIQILMEGKSEKAFDALNNINEDIKVKVIRNGNVDYINKNDVVVGDIVKIETGDKAPADGRLIDSSDLKIDESMLTGESIAVAKSANVIIENTNASLPEQVNMIFAGTFVTFGQGLMVVTSVGDNTEMGHIATELKGALETTTPLQEKLDKLAKSISTIGIIASGLIFLFEIYKIYINNALSFDTIQNAFMTSIALIVAAVPEGLPTIIAMTLSLNIIKMAKSNALVRKLVACETVGCINVICSDKTGTLTKNQMEVIDVWSNGDLVKPSDLKNKFMIENFTLNSTADIKSENGNIKFIGNSTESALLKAFGETICSISPKACPHYMNNSFICGGECKKYHPAKDEFITYNDVRHYSNILHQYPFTSETKSMTTVVKDHGLNRVYTKGSPEKIIALCNKIIINNKVQPFTDELKQRINHEITKLQEEAKRVLGFCHNNMNKTPENWQESQSEIEKDMIFDGFVSIADPLREDVYEAIEKCNKSGIGLKILTGDNIVTATSIAKQLNIVKEDSIIIEATEIDNMSNEELLKIMDKIIVIARSKPLTKMRIVKLLKERGNVVAVTGDGINDAPALKNADVGIAMGITGTEVSKEASDIILLDDSFSTIVKSVEWGRGIYENFQRFIQFQLTVNLVAVLTVIICEILGRDLPFTTIQLLWVNLIMDGPPALSLGLESLRNHLMEKEPVKRDASIITKGMLYRIITNGLYIVIMLMILITKNVLGGTPQQQSSIIFTTFVLFQLFNAFNSRELGDESVFSNLSNNKSMVLIVGATFVLQVFITQFGGQVFRTAPLSIEMWLKVVGYSFSVIVFSETIKFVKRMVR